MISRYKPLLLSLSFLTLYALTIVFAVPPLTQYTPGETLDPSCAPGDTNCSVLLSSGWGLTGNAGTTAGTNFIGTTDDVDVVIRRNNTQMLRFSPLNAVSIGVGAGQPPSNAYFFGTNAGVNAGNAIFSNFIGWQSGLDATNANNSNFIGISSGQGATGAQFSNFIGQNAGLNATGASNSNFIGGSAGRDVVTATNSNFIGSNTGRSATNAFNSNFIGVSAGRDAPEASVSNFIGVNAGRTAINANNSNFIGNEAGSSATNANSSNFIGLFAGSGATNASFSNLIGRHVGRTFTGNNIGFNNIIIGTNISLPNAATNRINIGGVIFGTGAYGTISGDPSIVPSTNAQVGIGVVSPHTSSIFELQSTNRGLLIPRMTTAERNAIVGPATGLQIYNTTTNQFNFWNGSTWSPLVSGTAWSLTGNAGTNPTTNFIGTTDDQDVVFRRNNAQVARFILNSSFIGEGAGLNSTDVTSSLVFGRDAGQNATDISLSNFIGQQSGIFSAEVSISNFIGLGAGEYTNGLTESNFIGTQAGSVAFSSSYSNFIGSNAGQGAIESPNSNFIGRNAGRNAQITPFSNFIGTNAGQDAAGATYSNIFGFNTGRTFSGNSIGSNNIIIGTNISLPNATANAINLGGVLFGTNTYATTTGNPSILPVNNGRIGIATNTLNYTFQAGNNTVTGIVARFQNSTGTCDINPTTTSLVCSSDETLKSNITTLSSSLSLLSQLRPVTYSWTSDSSSTPQIGFIAQEVEQIFPNLVFTDTTTGLKSLAYTNLIPYTISALQDINLSLTTLDDTQKPNVVRDALVRFLESATNGLQRIFVKQVETDRICMEDVCVEKEELSEILQIVRERKNERQRAVVSTPASVENAPTKGGPEEGGDNTSELEEPAEPAELPPPEQTPTTPTE